MSRPIKSDTPIEELVLFIKYNCIDTSDAGLVWVDFDKATDKAKALISSIIGEDIAVGESKVAWGGNGSVSAENADDLRNAWNNQLRQEQRERLGL